MAVEGGVGWGVVYDTQKNRLVRLKSAETSNSECVFVCV